MEPPCEPIEWTQPLQLPRAGSLCADFLWSQPGSFQDREVYGHSASVVGDTVWVLGGKNQSGKRISVHCFCPKTLTWSNRSPADSSYAPCARWGHSVCEVPGALLLVVGGFDQKHNLRDTWGLDTEDGSFVDLCDDLLIFGAYHSIVFDDATSCIVLFGGQCCVNGPYEYYNDVHVLDYADPSEETPGWLPALVKGNAPAPRAQHGAVLAFEMCWCNTMQRRSKMVVYGGADAHHQFNDVWMLDLVNYTWQELRPSNLSEPPPPVEALQEQHFRVKSSRSILGLHEMKLMVLGQGRGRSSKKYGLYVFDLQRQEWKIAPTMQGRPLWRGNAAGWISHDELWVHGGHLGDDTQPRQVVLRLQSGPTALIQRTVRGIVALPHENLKLVFSFLSGSVADLLWS
ncbi:unnamed protein product [Durusdinium trenchii]|uniref:Uncharacterized protein n=1 Tax=Durusdinium trenchii TaxID=1381693 RepID=A0ABP0SZI5_9DINO